MSWKITPKGAVQKMGSTSKCPGHIRPPGTVTVRNAAGPMVHPAELVELPFYDKEKSIPRGLE